MKACEKRPVSLMQLEQIVDNVEQKVFGSLESEVSSKVIGELVMEQLRKVDEVAYVRFASVYRQFKDINTFMEELNTLIKDKQKSSDKSRKERYASNQAMYQTNLQEKEEYRDAGTANCPDVH